MCIIKNFVFTQRKNVNYMAVTFWLERTNVYTRKRLFILASYFLMFLSFVRTKIELKSDTFASLLSVKKTAGLKDTFHSSRISDKFVIGTRPVSSLRARKFASLTGNELLPSTRIENLWRRSDIKSHSSPPITCNSCPRLSDISYGSFIVGSPSVKFIILISITL